MTSHHHTDFPILDGPRDHELSGRVVLDCFGYVEPYVEELDHWVALPVRLAHSALDSFTIEVGPYTFSGSDLRLLRAALEVYDAAIHCTRVHADMDDSTYNAVEADDPDAGEP